MICLTLFIRLKIVTNCLTLYKKWDIDMDIGLILYGGLCIGLGIGAIGFAIMFILDDYR